MMTQQFSRGTLVATSMASARLASSPVLAPLPRKPWRKVAGRSLSRLTAHGLGEDGVKSWLDLASFVAKSGSGRTPYEELADKIGRDIYIDVAGWHLYLKDVRLGNDLSLAQGLAQQLGAQIDGGSKGGDLDALLKKVPIKLGQGKVTVALSEVLPAACMRDLERICEDYARR